jgi:hypothetical protein
MSTHYIHQAKFSNHKIRQAKKKITSDVALATLVLGVGEQNKFREDISRKSDISIGGEGRA